MTNKRNIKFNRILYNDSSLYSPSMVRFNGEIIWEKEIHFSTMEYHRENGKPCIISPRGIIEFREYGQPHRINNKPALIRGNFYEAYYDKGCQIDFKITENTFGL